MQIGDQVFISFIHSEESVITNTTSNHLLDIILGLLCVCFWNTFLVSLGTFLWTQVSRASYYFLDMPQIIRSHVNTCHLFFTQDANPSLVSTSPIHPSSSPECTRTFGSPRSLCISHGSYVKEIDIFSSPELLYRKKALCERGLQWLE